MIDELLKTARRSHSGRRILTSDQKRLIVDSWENSGLSAPEFCRRHELIVALLYK